MNLNESDRIFSEHEMYCKLLMARELTLGEKSKCKNIGVSVMTFWRSESSAPFPKTQKEMNEKSLISQQDLILGQ